MAMLRILGAVALLTISGELPAFGQAGNTGTGRVRLLPPQCRCVECRPVIGSIVPSSERLCK
jgi:hypothetical protein